MADNHLSDLRFDSLTLHDNVRAGIRDAGFEFSSERQMHQADLQLVFLEVHIRPQSSPSHASGKAQNSQKVVIVESTITGSSEQPKVLYIVPWQASVDPPLLQQWIDGKAAVSVLEPLAPCIFWSLVIVVVEQVGSE